MDYKRLFTNDCLQTIVYKRVAQRRWPSQSWYRSGSPEQIIYESIYVRIHTWKISSLSLSLPIVIQPCSRLQRSLMIILLSSKKISKWFKWFLEYALEYLLNSLHTQMHPMIVVLISSIPIDFKADRICGDMRWILENLRYHPQMQTEINPTNGVTLGSCWGHFGVILGPRWGHFGVILGQVFAKRSTIIFCIGKQLK